MNYRETGAQPDRYSKIAGSDIYGRGTFIKESLLDKHIDQVVYKFDGLDSYRSYELAIECCAGDNQDRQQNVTVNGVEIIESFKITSKTKRIRYVQLPGDSFSGGELKVSINSLDVGSAVLS